MDENLKILIKQDHELEGLSYRNLAEKYGMDRTEIHRIVMSKANKDVQKPQLTSPVGRDLQSQIKFWLICNQRDFNTLRTRITNPCYCTPRL